MKIEKLPCLGLAIAISLFTLVACSRPLSDRQWMRREFSLPVEATESYFSSRPREDESGTFGREGLYIKAIYHLPTSALAQYETGIKQSLSWHKLPLPQELRESFRLEPKLENFFDLHQSGNIEIKRGFYRCQTVGDQMLHSEVRKEVAAGKKVDDYILGIIDLDSGKLYCVAHAFY